MFRPRVIPVLLLRGSGLVKSVQFGRHQYVGDPLNAVRIFNELKADELVFLDINASKEKRHISTKFVESVGSQANMPFAVGGGVSSLDDIRRILAAGAEKVILNTVAVAQPSLVMRAVEEFGSSTISVCIDVKKTFFRGPRVFSDAGTKVSSYAPVEFARLMQEQGVGELLLQSINKDGTMEGYDLDLISQVARAVDVPVVSLGGAGCLSDLGMAYHKGFASAMAAGSLFVFHDKKRGVLINYPEKASLLKVFSSLPHIVS